MQLNRGPGFKDVVSNNFAPILDALWRADIKQAEDGLNALLLKSISFHDSAENFYHGFAAGLFCMADCIVKSNRESGDGRSDLSVHDSKHARGMILELKCAGAKESLDRAAQAALSQIGRKRCDVELDLPRDAILRFGRAFRRKTCAERAAASPDAARQGRRRKARDAGER